MENLFSFMDKAGPVGFIIVATSVIALCIVLDRVWAYRLLRIKDPKSLHRLCKRALEGHLGSAADAAKGETQLRPRRPRPLVCVSAKQTATWPERTC